MNTDSTAQTHRSIIPDRSQALPDSPPPAYDVAIATDDPPAYNGVRLPRYTATARPGMLRAEHLSANGMVRLIIARSESVTSTAIPLVRDLDYLRRHAGDEIEIYSRLTEMRRTLELLRAAAGQRVAEAQALANRIRVYEEHIAALPAGSAEVTRADQQIAAEKQRLADVYQRAMSADDGVFRIQEFRREYELLERQLDPRSGTGSLLGRIGRRVNTWLAPMGDFSNF